MLPLQKLEDTDDLMNQPPEDDYLLFSTSESNKKTKLKQIRTSKNVCQVTMTMILYYRVSAKILPYIWFIYSTLILDRISSVPARTGKQWFYIHISWQKNPRPWDVKNPDRIGVFRGYIFFAYPLWWRMLDSNQWPLACQASALTCWANPPYLVGVKCVSSCEKFILRYCQFYKIY